MIWNRQKRVLAIPTLLFLPSIASQFTFNRMGLPDNDVQAMIYSPNSIDHIHIYVHFGSHNSRANERHDTVE
jgi:hypothetical protein